jgi:hypothetical protein
MVLIGPSPIHGKGAFATDTIPAGTVLECHVLPLNSTDSRITSYLFPYRGASTCIHLGWASFLNGSTSPNLRHLGVDPSCDVSRFETTTDVSVGEELTLPYLPG